MDTNKFLMLLVVLVMGIFLVANVSGATIDNVKFKEDKTFDNKSVKDNKLLEKYPPIKIKNMFGIGEDLFEGYLSKHNDFCGEECSSTIQIKLYNDDILIDNVIFDELQEDGSWISDPTINYNFYYLKNKKWELYTLGEEMKAGIYELKLDANKVANKTVDWKIETQGRLIDEWAIWQGVYDLEFTTSQTICGNYVGYNNIIVKSPAVVTVCPYTSGDTGIARLQSYGSIYVEAGATLTATGSGYEGGLFDSSYGQDGLDGEGLGHGLGGNYDRDCGSATAVSGGSGAGHVNSGGASDDADYSSTDANGVAGGVGGLGVINGVSYIIGAGGGTGGMASCNGLSRSGAGGFGGGVIMFDAPNVILAGTIEADGTDGADGQAVYASYTGGGSGGGAGGTLIINSNDLDITGGLSVVGGFGGEGYNDPRSTDGGIGGDGRIKVYSETSDISSATINVGSGTDYYLTTTYEGLSGYGLLELNSPVDNYNSSTEDVEFNVSATVYVSGTLVNMSLWTNETGTMEIRNVTTGLTTNTSTQVWTRPLSDGTYLWTAQACDDEGFCGFVTENRTVSVDATAPIVNVTSPIAKLDFGKAGEVIDLNWTVSDINLDSCWYEYGGVNTSVVCNASDTLTINSLTDNNLTFYANDTVGNLNSYYTDWTYFLWQGDATFNPVVGEVSDQTFTSNLSLPDGDTITGAKFIYDDVEYSPDIDLYDGGALLSYALTTPDVTETTNYTFYWQISINPVLNTTPETQTILAVNIDDCSNFTEVILNFTLIDEVTETEITGANSSIEVDLFLITETGSEILHYYKIYEDTPYAEVCMEELLNDTVYKMDVVASYVADGYVEEFWYLDDGTLELGNDNLNDYVSRNVTLRDLSIDDSTTFLFKYKDEFGVIHEDAIVTVLRYYIGQGITKDAEKCQQDSNGECHLHLVEEDVIYQFRITDQGILEYLSGEYNAKCLETICSITLSKLVGGGVWDDEGDNLEEGTFAVSSDKDTREVTLEFNLEETGEMQLDVFEYDQNAVTDTLIATDTVVAKSGSVAVLVPVVYGNTTYYSVVRYNDDFVSSQWVDMNDDGFKYFGNLGLFLAGLIILSLGLIAVSSGGWTIMFLLLGLLVASITKLVDMNFYLLMYIVSAGGLIIWKLSTRRSI